jgi:hypothetical protein
MAKESRSKAEIRRMIMERLNYPAYGVEIRPGATGSGSWHVSPYIQGSAPESILIRAKAIEKELQSLYSLEDEQPKAKGK